MTSITNTTITTHPLTQVTMSDGTTYDVTVSYLDQNGKPLSVCAFHENCQFEHSLALKDRLSSLLKAITETHANKSGIKSFRDIKVMTLTNDGITFDQTPLKKHDVDFDKSKTENFTQDAPTKELLNTCHKVADIWNKTSKLILDDYNCHTQDSIEGHVDEVTPAAASAFTLTQSDKKSNRTTVDVVLDPKTPTQQGMLSTGLGMIGNAAGSIAAGLGESVFRGIKHMLSATTPATTSSDLQTDTEATQSSTSLAWTNSLEESAKTINESEALKSITNTFNAAKSKDENAVSVLINKTYEFSKRKNHNFEQFVERLTTQFEDIASHLTDDLKKTFKDETIKKLEEHFNALIEQITQTTNTWTGIAISLFRTSNPRGTLKEAYIKAKAPTFHLITSKLGLEWTHDEQNALFKKLFP
ncbi:MAG: hypothetical protein WCG10_07525 [Chlamydiota bacterium]